MKDSNSRRVSWTRREFSARRIGWRRAFFTLSTWQLAIVLTAITFGATLLGLWAGRSLSVHTENLHESLGIVQGALLTLIGLVLAFGLAMAVGRYELRRDALVGEVNAITTSYLRAQTLHEPVRSRSLPRFRQYTDASFDLSRSVRAPKRRSMRSRRERLCSVASGASPAPRSPPIRSSPRRGCTSRPEHDDRRADHPRVRAR